MEESGFKKDQTPYFVFTCRKCHQYAYVKTTQKTKKCLRCGRTHQVSSLADEEVVLGMTAAVDAVKLKQTELANPEFRSGSDFVVSSPPNRKSFVLNKKHKVITQSETSNDQEEIDYYDKFVRVLRELSKEHRSFPKYMIEIVAETHKIPLEEINQLVHRFVKDEILSPVKGKQFYYTLNKS